MFCQNNVSGNQSYPYIKFAIIKNVRVFNRDKSLPSAHMYCKRLIYLKGRKCCREKGKCNSMHQGMMTIEFVITG